MIFNIIDIKRTRNKMIEIKSKREIELMKEACSTLLVIILSIISSLGEIKFITISILLSLCFSISSS